MKVGVVGLGVVGSRIASCLCDAGHEVAVADVDIDRMEELRSVAEPIWPPRGLAGSVDAIFVSVPGPQASHMVALDPLTGALDGMSPGSLYIETTTSSLALSRSIESACETRSVLFVEAPLSNLPPDSTMFLGGSDEALEEALPLLKDISQEQFHLGSVGCGSVGKQVNQLLAFANFITAVQGFLLAENFDVDRVALFDALRVSFADSKALGAYGEHVLSGELDSSSGTLSGIAKDMALARETASAAGIRLPILDHVQQVFDDAERDGWGDKGFARVTHTLRSQILRPDDRSTKQSDSSG